MLDGCRWGKEKKERGVREETGLNVFQLFENKQSSMLEYLQGWGWDTGGNPHVLGWFLWILGNPPNERQASMIGQLLFFLYFIPEKRFQHKTLRPNYLSLRGTFRQKQAKWLREFLQKDSYIPLCLVETATPNKSWMTL